jgi:hypothetical protein
MYSSIILSSGLFGSVYLFSKSLDLINRFMLENKKIPSKLIIINDLSFVMTGYIFVYSVRLLL